MQSQIAELFKISTTSLKEVVDVDTIIGETIILDNNVSIIPISKVKCSFATGGAEQGKVKVENDYPFGGATGGMVNIQPIAFLTIYNGEIKLLHLEQQTHLLEKLIDQVPEAITTIKELFAKTPQVEHIRVVEHKEE